MTDIQPPQPSDIERLRATFPDWEFEAIWTTAGTGPDRRYLLAYKGGATIASWSADDLAALIAAGVIIDTPKREDKQP